MRRVLALTTALAFCGPMAAQAAGSGTSSDVTQLVGAYQHIQSVRVVENFENGAVATVDVIPSGQYRDCFERRARPLADHQDCNAAGRRCV